MMSNRLSITLAFLFVLAALGSSQNCRCLPSDPCWPSGEEWQALNVSVGGRLIIPQLTVQVRSFVMYLTHIMIN